MKQAALMLYAISGSVRQRSTNSALLRAMAGAAPDGVRVEICQCIGDLPIFNPDLEGELTPSSVEDFAGKVAAADGLIIACPEYAHGIPGGLKNALDWLVSRNEIPFKPVMLVRASTRGEHAHAALCEVLKTMSVALMPEPALGIHLLGKPPAEINTLLASPATLAMIRDALSRYAAFAHNAGITDGLSG